VVNISYILKKSIMGMWVISRYVDDGYGGGRRVNVS
jgi:hypothetical protein